MKFGLLLPQTNWVASTSAIRDVAQAAEALGFDALSVHDHIQYNGWFIASGSREPVPGGDQRNLYEALAVLAYVAGVTTRVRLLTSILLVHHTVDDLLVQLRLIADEVMPAVPEPAA